MMEGKTVIAIAYCLHHRCDGPPHRLGQSRIIEEGSAS